MVLVRLRITLLPKSGRGAAQSGRWGTVILAGIRSDGRLWGHEMGPKGRLSLNLDRKAELWLIPLVSQAKHYGWQGDSDHDTRP